jgi:uncharacterized phage infection (PIP) family protein YhgE
MTILVFAVAAFLVGALLGLFFKVFIVLPVMTVSLAAVVGIGFKYESSFGFVLFVSFVGITALQMGYLFGSMIGVYVAEANGQKRCMGIIETAQKLFRQFQA